MDFLQDHSDNERLNLIRYIATEAKGEANTVVYVFPIILQRDYGIKLDSIRATLDELQDRECIDIINRPNLRLTDEQRTKRDDEEDYFFLEVLDGFYDYAKALETAADFFGTTTHDSIRKHNASRLTANLAFDRISVPVVTIGNNTYSFPSMRTGKAFNIISYCLESIPNKMISLDDLKVDLKARQIPAQGITNLRESIRKSLFGDNQPLNVFVRVSSQGIVVRSEVELSNEQLSAIIKASDSQKK